MRILNIVMLSALFVFMNQSVYAADDSGSTATIKVLVDITAPPCTINNNQTIDIDFGDSVVASEVSKGGYSVPVNYTLDCNQLTEGNSLEMTISGAGADFDSTLLNTSMAGLGIKLSANSEKYPLNTSLDFSSVSEKPELVATLIKDPARDLGTGEFTAGATMQVKYQ